MHARDMDYQNEIWIMLGLSCVDYVDTVMMGVTRLKLEASFSESGFR